jgi:tRNA dimethylallyltransferase
MNQTESAVLLVAGPTASGKSALAAMLAEKLHGVVINCDALQVYRDLPLLTAQPDAATQARVPHWLYATIDPAQTFSAGQWLRAAQTAITEAKSQGMIPIITGGTGMYFHSLINGLAEIPDISDELRQHLRADYATKGESVMRARLAALDPEAAQRIEVNDQLRLLRALEIVLETGKTQRAWQDNTSGGIGGSGGTHNVIPLLLLPPRAQLYDACDQRFCQMIERGAVAEVKALLPRHLPTHLPAMKTIGVREIMDFLTDKQDWDTAQAAAQQATRNYAKRQFTWFRNQWVSNKIGFDKPVFVKHGFYTPACDAEFLAACQIQPLHSA